MPHTGQALISKAKNVESDLLGVNSRKGKIEFSKQGDLALMY